jgi:hypothetical protein
MSDNRCEYNSVIRGYKWSMRDRVNSWVFGQCKKQKKYHIEIIRKNNPIKASICVCGTHKNLLLKKFPSSIAHALKEVQGE